MDTIFLKRDQGMIAYEIRGKGPLVVCAPSIGDLRAEYRFLAPRLASAGFCVASLDVRGHGDSSTGWDDYSVSGVGSDLIALIRELDAGPAILVGTSMSAGAAVWAAAEAPELVSALVLIDPFVRGEGSIAQKLMFAVLFAWPWGTSVWLRYYTSLYPSRKPDDFDDYLAALKANLVEPGRMKALKKMMYASKKASEERISKVKAPSLVLMGSRDPDFKDPEAEARWVADALGTRYKMIPEAGHYPHAELPEVAGKIIVSFCKG
jgi:pimeloyl-ACP methyl ester carboxylesterase